MLFPTGKAKILFVGFFILLCANLSSAQNMMKMKISDFKDMSFIQRTSVDIIVKNDDFIVFNLQDDQTISFRNAGAEMLSRVPADYDSNIPSLVPETGIPSAWVIEPGNQGSARLSSWHNYVVYTENTLAYLYSDVNGHHTGFQFLDLETGEKRLLEIDEMHYDSDEALYVVGGEHVIYCAFHFHDPAINNSNMRYYWYDSRSGEDGWITDFGYGFEGCGASDEWIIRTGNKGNGWNNQLWAYNRITGQTFEMLADSIPEQWRYDRMGAPAVNGNTIVYNYEYNLTSQRDVKIYSLGEDGVYGTADDRAGILKSDAAGSRYKPASIHGRYIVWNENDPGDIGGYDMGPDALYGTDDDVGTVDICSNSAFQDRPYVHNGIAVWQDWRHVDSYSMGGPRDVYGYDFETGTEFRVTTISDTLELQGLQGLRAVINKLDYYRSDDADIYALSLSGLIQTRLFEIQLNEDLYAEAFSYITGTGAGTSLGEDRTRQMAVGSSSAMYVSKIDRANQIVLLAYSAYTGTWETFQLAYTGYWPLRISITYEGDQAMIMYSGSNGDYVALYDAVSNTITDQFRSPLPTGFAMGKNYALIWGDGTTHDNWMQLYETSQKSWQSVNWNFTNTPAHILDVEISDSLILVLRGVEPDETDTTVAVTLLGYHAANRTWESEYTGYSVSRFHAKQIISQTLSANTCHVIFDIPPDAGVRDKIYTYSTRHDSWQNYPISSSGDLQKPLIGDGFSLIPSLYSTLWTGYVYDHTSMSWLPEPLQSPDGVDDCQFSDGVFSAWKTRTFSASVWVYAPGMEAILQKSFLQGEKIVNLAVTEEAVYIGTKYASEPMNRLYVFLPKEGVWQEKKEFYSGQPDSLKISARGHCCLASCRNYQGELDIHAFSTHSNEWTSLELESLKDIQCYDHYGLVIYEDNSSRNHFKIYNAVDNKWSSAEYMAHTARNYKYEGQKRIFLLTFAGSNATQTAVAAVYSPVLDYWSETVFDQTYAFPNTDITRTAAMAWVSGSFKLIFNNDTQWNEKRGELITLRSADDLIYCRMYQNSSYENYYFYPPAEEIVEDFAFLEDPEITLLSSWTAEIKWKTNQASDTRLAWVYGDTYDVIVQDTLEHVKDHKVTLHGLNAEQTYFWSAASVIPETDTLYTDTLQFTTPGDETPPRITKGPKPYRIHDTEAGVWWTMDEPGTGIVVWGETSAYSDTVQATDTSLTPSVRIYGLEKGKTYHYKVGMTDRYGNGPAYSSDFTFVTDNQLPVVHNLTALDSTIWGCAYMSWDPPEVDSLMDKETFSHGIPIDWKVLNLGDDARGITWTSGYDGNNSVAYCSYGNPGETQEEWLITSPVTINNQTGGVLNFWHYGIYGEYDNAPNRVMMSTTGIDKEDFSTIWSSSILTDYWELEQIELNWQENYGKTVRFAFVYNSTDGEIWVIDNISLDKHVDGFYEGFSDGGNVWDRWSTSSGGGWSSANSMASSVGYDYLPNENTEMDRWLVSPRIQISESHHLLGFSQTGWFPEYDMYPNEVRIMSARDGYSYSDVVLSVYPVPTEWQWKTINLSQYIGEQVYVAFRYHSWAGLDYYLNSWFGENWYIDDVFLFENEPAAYKKPGYKPGDKMLIHRSLPDGKRLDISTVSTETVSKMMQTLSNEPGEICQAPAEKPVSGLLFPALDVLPAPSALSTGKPVLQSYAVYGRYPWESTFTELGYVKEPRFIDWNTYLGQKQEYYVEAVYDQGQSQPCEKVTLSGGITPPESEYFYDSGVLGYSYWWYPGNAFANEFNFEDSLFQPSAIRFHAEYPGAVKVNLYGLDHQGYLDLAYTQDVWISQRGWQKVTIPATIEEDCYFLAEIECRDSLFSLTYDNVPGDVSWDFYNETYQVAPVTYFIRLQGEVTGEVSVSDPENISYQLGNNYPNPFNPVTVIPYRLAEDGETTLRIFDVSGALVKTLAQQRQTAGSYRVTWNGTDASGHPLASGVYLVKLTSGDFSASQKLLLIR